jgi:hypothetical protein
LTARLLALEDTLPPEILVPGHRLSQEAKCLALLQRDNSGPTSASTFSKVAVSMPSMRVRSTPQRRNSAVRRSNFAALRGRPRPQELLQLLVALRDRLPVGIVEGNGLLQGEQMFLPPVAFERFDDLLFARADALMP